MVSSQGILGAPYISEDIRFVHGCVCVGEGGGAILQCSVCQKLSCLALSQIGAWFSIVRQLKKYIIYYVPENCTQLPGEGHIL